MAWDLLVDRSDLTRTEIVEVDPPAPGPGQAVLRVDRVGMTANNVTYAVFGDAMRYWEFFPGREVDGVAHGRVPLWGFAEVEATAADGVDEGTRVYGYLPTSSHLVVEPAKVDERGFRDASAHRRVLPPVYNGLVRTDRDPLHTADSEDLQVLFRPLFTTSFVLADLLADNRFFGGDAVVLTSASSKTSFGTAALLDGVHRIGLTSEGNRGFTEGLGTYDEVRTYDEIEDLAARPAVLVDIAGDGAVRRRVHERLAPVHSAVVGATHHDAAPDLGGAGELPGAPPTFFFAPDQIAKRTEEWGPAGLEERLVAAWQGFLPTAEGAIDVVEAAGPEGLQADWLEVLGGSTPPRTGHVISLADG